MDTEDSTDAKENLEANIVVPPVPEHVEKKAKKSVCFDLPPLPESPVPAPSETPAQAQIQAQIQAPSIIKRANFGTPSRVTASRPAVKPASHNNIALAPSSRLAPTPIATPSTSTGVLTRSATAAAAPPSMPATTPALRATPNNYTNTISLTPSASILSSNNPKSPFKKSSVLASTDKRAWNASMMPPTTTGSVDALRKPPMRVKTPVKKRKADAYY